MVLTAVNVTMFCLRVLNHRLNFCCGNSALVPIYFNLGRYSSLTKLMVVPPIDGYPWCVLCLLLLPNACVKDSFLERAEVSQHSYFLVDRDFEEVPSQIQTEDRNACFYYSLKLLYCLNFPSKNGRLRRPWFVAVFPLQKNCRKTVWPSLLDWF
jgi:hypothetical protein